MKNKKLIITIAPMLLFVLVLSGCTGPGAITTWGWDHTNTEGTAVRLWGHLTLSENFHNWNAWFVWDIESHDDWELYANRVEADNYDALNYFSVDIGDLDRTTEYHYRAVGEHQGVGSVVRMGADATFIPGGPRVWTDNASNIELTSVMLHGQLIHMGGAATCEVFFEYGDDENHLDMETTPEIMTSTGDFEAMISDLESGTTYYYRAIAENDADTWVGLIFSITPGKPVVETYLPTDITSTTAVFHGTLFHMGGPSTCEVWFEYGDDNPNNLDESTPPQVMDTTGSFESYVEGLNSDTTYWVRAVADNGVLTDKGEIKEFKTLSGKKRIILHLIEDLFDSKNIENEVESSSSNQKRPILVQMYNRLKNIDGEFIEELLENNPLMARFVHSQIKNMQ
jgi:hypothetical protein